MTVSLDTDIAIEILRGRNKVISSKWSALAASGTVVLYSPVVAAELWAGALPHEHRLISVFFQPLICVATDYEIGELAGALLRKFAKSHSLEIPDALIAATAIHHEAALWTRNRKHYPMPELTFYS
ncbi:MAG: type II toxin-antitoxin system VapC family toxin [Terracidiphilus sp.]